MEINPIWIFFYIVISFVALLAWLAYSGKREDVEKHIPNGERYSKLEIFKSIERNGEVIYYLGDERNQIEVSKVDYDYAIKVYQESIRNEK
ncbi:hypothetical protein [Providencia stuartii]|uniref:hypothetical protein n=1 Tax=Providencia stuartii TaxID=588 RepID=UPI0004F72B0E|nr:hypothetical protein [Providencia stuartii]HAZ8239560.1 hypothetical protein [Escherichia coli]AIN62188.1 hypothetical protein DR96_4015 [Providencia stuartii]EMD1719260.1 hypothetical protein [Providencia stuartii]MBG5909835.1 hypothetical protein [Providencia stuartii]MBG5937407.1 hypothetical protein [Providencia stuartii]